MFDWIKDRQKQKEYEKEYQISVLVSDSISEIDDTCEELRDVAQQLHKYATEAAEKGRDNYVDNLAETIATIMYIVDELELMVLDIRAAFVTTKVFKGLAKLPPALKSIKTKIQAVNFNDLGKDMAFMRNSLSGVLSQLVDIRKGFSNNNLDDVIIPGISRRKKSASADPEHVARVNDIKKSIIASIQTKGSRPDPTPAPVVHDTPTDVANNAANATDIASMLDDEQDE